MQAQKSTRSAFDLSHVKSVHAAAILKDGVQVGKVVANFSDNPNGSVCTCTVVLWDGERSQTSATGRAGGYGYDKFGAAFNEAAKALGLTVKYSGNNPRTTLEENGYTYAEVI